MPGPPPTDPPGEASPGRESALGELLAAVYAADTHDELAEHRALELSPAGVSALGREVRQLERPLQVLLRFAGEGPRQPLVADVLEYADEGRHLVVALPPVPPVRPLQGGTIHLLGAAPPGQEPPLFTVRSVESGTMVQLAAVEVGGAGTAN